MSLPIVSADRVKETSTTTGTGIITLLGTTTGYQTFASAIGVGNSTYYAIVHQTLSEWEVGVGTIVGGPDRISRIQILAGTNGTSPVNFSAGTTDAFCTYPASRSISYNPDGTLTLSGIISLTGNINSVGSISASNGNVSAISGNFQYVTGTFAGVITTAISASYATTASWALATLWSTLIGRPSGLVSASTQVSTGSFLGNITSASFANFAYTP